jgi:hypothetical protein
MRTIPFALLLCGAVQLGCGAASSSSGSSNVSVALDQSAASVTVLRQRPFVATVSGTSNGAVTWSVSEGIAGGVVDGSGLYSAPSTPGTYHLVARSVADPSRSAIATVSAVATPVIAFFVASPAEIVPGAPVALTATFAEGTALINPGMVAMTSGVPLPVNPSASTVYVLSVTNAAGTTVAAAAAVTVSGQVAVGVLPGVVTVAQGSAQPFQALVTGAIDTSVTWSVQEGDAGGTVGADGLYAPPPRGGTYHVVATSVLDPAKQAAAIVTVPRAWQPRLVVSSLFDAGSMPILRGNDAGDLMILYLQNGLLRARLYSGSTESWAPEAVLGPVFDFTSSSLAPDGTIRLLYSYISEIRSRRWNGTAWEPDELLRTMPPATSAFGLSIASEPGGTALAAWQENGVSASTLWSTGFDGTAWTAAQRVDLYPNLPTPPVVTLRSGLGWVAWIQSDGSVDHYFTAQWTGSAIATATPRTSVPPAGYPRPYSGPALGMRDDGTTWLTYQQIPSFNGTPDGWVSAYSGGGWSNGLLETSSAGVRWSAVPNRGPKALRLWTHDEGAGFTITANGQSLSPFVSLGPVGGVITSDVATTGRAALAWQEGGDAETPVRLVAVVYDHAALEWGQKTVIASYTSSYFIPTVAVAADGTAATAWADIPAGEFASKVQVRHYR